MSFYQFPSNFIYWYNVDKKEHTKIKDILLPKIELDESENKDNRFFTLGSGAITNHGRYPSYLFDDYITKTIVWNPLDEMLKKYNKMDTYNIELNDSKITNTWYTTYRVGDFFERHDHKTYPFIPPGENELYYPSFSFIYILHDENEKSPLVFTDVNDYKFSPTFQLNFDTGDVKDIKEGTVIIFPSHLSHAVKKNEKGKRISLAYNIASTFRSF